MNTAQRLHTIETEVSELLREKSNLLRVVNGTYCVFFYPDTTSTRRDLGESPRGLRKGLDRPMHIEVSAIMDSDPLVNEEVNRFIGDCVVALASNGTLNIERV